LVGDLFRVGWIYDYPKFDDLNRLAVANPALGFPEYHKDRLHQILHQMQPNISLGRMVVLERQPGHFEVVVGEEILVFVFWLLIGLKEATQKLVAQGGWKEEVVAVLMRTIAILDWNSRCRVLLGNKGVKGEFLDYFKKLSRVMFSGEKGAERLLALIQCFRHRLWVEHIWVKDYRMALHVFDSYHDPCFPVSEAIAWQRRNLQRLADQEGV